MEVRISFHAMQRAEARMQEFWVRGRAPGEPFNRWLHRVAGEAVTKGRIVRADRRQYRRMVFVYDFGVDPARLITVMHPNPRNHGERFGPSKRRIAILSERAERMLERNAALARGEDE